MTHAACVAEAAVGDEPGPACVVDIRLHDAVPVSHMLFQRGWLGSCTSAIEGAVLTPAAARPGRLSVEFPDGFTGPATILTCEALYANDECPAESLGQLWDEFGAVEATAPDGSSIARLTMCPASFACDEWPCLGEPGPFVAAACADPTGDGRTMATDALFALQAAIRLVECEREQCDTDDDGAVTASDALRILAAGLGLDVDLRCPFPCAARALTADDGVVVPPLAESPPPAFAMVVTADRGTGVPGTVFGLSVDTFGHVEPLGPIAWTVNGDAIEDVGDTIALDFDAPGDYAIAATAEDATGSTVTAGTVVRVFDPDDTVEQPSVSIAPEEGIAGTLVRIEAPALTDPAAVVLVSVDDGEPFEPYRPELGAASFVMSLDAAEGQVEPELVSVTVFVDGEIAETLAFLLQPSPVPEGEPGALLRAWLVKGPDLVDAVERQLIAAALGLAPDMSADELALLQGLLRFSAGRLMQIEAALSDALDRLDDTMLTAVDQALVANGATQELLGRVSGSTKRARAVAGGNDQLIADTCRFHDINRALIAVAHAAHSAETLLHVLSLRSILAGIAAAEPIAVELGLDGLGFAADLVGVGVIADVLHELDEIVPDVRDELEVTATPSVLPQPSDRATVRVRAFFDDPTEFCARPADELLRDLARHAAERVTRLAANGEQAYRFIARSLFGGPGASGGSPGAVSQFQGFLADVINAITSGAVSGAGLDGLLASVRERLCAQSSGAGISLRPTSEFLSMQPSGAGSFSNEQEDSIEFECSSSTKGQVTLRYERACGARADGAGPRVLAGEVRVTCGKEPCTESAVDQLEVTGDILPFDRPSACGFVKETLDLRIADVYFRNTHPTRMIALAVIGVEESDKQPLPTAPCEDIGNFATVEECVERITAGCNTPAGLFLTPGQESTYGHIVDCRREELYNPDDGSSSGMCGDLTLETIRGHLVFQAVYCDDHETAQDVFCARAHEQLVRFGLPAPEFGEGRTYAPTCP